MVHLHEGGAAVFVDDVHQFFQPLDEAVVVDAVARAPAGARRVVDGGRLDDDEPRAAARHALVECQHFRPHVSVVLVPHEHAGAGLENAIPGGDRPDLAGGEERLVRRGHSQCPFEAPE